MYVEPVTSFLKNIFHWTNGFPPGSWLAVCALWIWDLVALKWWGGHIYWYFTVDCLTFSIELTLSRTVDHLGHPLLYTPEERCPTFQPTLLLLSRFSCVQLCATPQTAAHQAPHPWDSPGKNTGVGCRFLLQCMKVKSESEVAQSCPTLCPTPWTAAHQAPPSMRFSRQEYYSTLNTGSLSCLTLYTFTGGWSLPHSCMGLCSSVWLTSLEQYTSLF